MLLMRADEGEGGQGEGRSGYGPVFSVFAAEEKEPSDSEDEAMLQLRASRTTWVTV